MSVRSLWRRFTGDDVLDRLAVRDQETARAFRGALDDAPPGTYFRTLQRAVAGSAPFGQPVDFPRLVAELAVLEQRIADLEQ